MKSLLILVCTCLLVSNLSAQTNVSVFSEKGERFWVTINGIKQNTKASQNVKVTNLNGSFWKMRVIFENQNIPEISQNVGTMELNQELTYQVKQNRKGEYVVRMFSIAPIAQSTHNAEVTIPYHPTELPDNTPNNPSTTININENKQNPSEFSIKVNENGFDMKINVPNDDTTIRTNTNTTTTTTWNTQNTNVNTSNNNTSNNCWQAMNSYDFSNAKNLVKKESFEDNKMQIAQQFTRKNCLSLSQVKEIATLFTFEENKFEYVKFAYDFCLEKSNYYQLNDIFTFSATKDDFNEFLKDK